MKIRLVPAAVLVSAIALSSTVAQAGGVPVMDGKKVKALSVTVSSGVTDNDKDQANTGTIDHYACPAPRCVKVKFVYKPAKGVKGGLMFTATWTKPALTDIDLYVFALDKRGNGEDVGHCGLAGTASEKVYLPPAALKSGSTYVMMIDQFRTVNDVVTAKVAIGVPNSIPTTIPSKAETTTGIPFNCIL